MSDSVALSTRAVGKTFGSGAGRVEALKNVSLRVERGQSLAVLGPNGAGKSTLFDILLGLIDADCGEVSVLGGSPREALATGKVGAALQNGGFLPGLTVGDTLRFTAVSHRGSRPEGELLETCGLRPNARVGKLSGGELQRLRITVAMASNPQLLILDEPTTGLDVSARAEFWASLTSLGRGLTTVFATHYLEEAQEYATHTALLSQGQVVAHSTTEEIRSLTDLSTIRISFDDTSPQMLNKIISDAGLPPHGGLRFSGERVEVRSSIPEALTKALLDAGGHHLEVQPASLSEVFKELTRGRAN